MIATQLRSVRLLLHALDRTGPPMLALAFARWLHRTHSDISIQTVAFRGGELIDEYTRIGPTTVLLDPSEPWSHGDESELRLERLRSRARWIDDVDVMLSVSLSGTQTLPYLPEPLAPLCTWVVERGEDLHWLEHPVHPSVSASHWLAGSAGAAADLAASIDGPREIPVVPEFVEEAHLPAPQVIANRRAALGADAADLLVVGAGIATPRKGPDLIIELAAVARMPGARFAWLGGERDEQFHRYVAEGRRLGAAGPRFFGNVADISGWLAAADVLCHTARLDAFPLVCLHAALAGTPVVGFADVAGLEEMFGDAALTVPYPDVAGLAQLLLELRDPARRRTAAAQQRHAVSGRHVSEVAGPTLLAELSSCGAPA